MIEIKSLINDKIFNIQINERETYTELKIWDLKLI